VGVLANWRLAKREQIAVKDILGRHYCLLARRE
jgi:hypothetical protein